MSSKQKSILAGLILLALVLLGILIGLSNREKPQFIAQDLPGKLADSEVYTQENPAYDIEQLRQPPPQSAWLGQKYGKMIPVGGPIPEGNPTRGTMIFYAPPEYAKALLGGLGPSYDIPAAVVTVKNNFVNAWSEEYGLSEIRKGSPRIHVSVGEQIAWFYNKQTNRTIQVSVSDPRRLDQVLSDLIITQ